MTGKTLALAGIALLMAILLFLDYSNPENGSAVPASVRREKRAIQLSRIIRAEKPIQRAYGQISGPYAEQMAELATAFWQPIEPKQTVSLVLKTLLDHYGAQIERLEVREPQKLGDGVFSVEVDLQLFFTENQAALKVLQALANYHSGLMWQSFQLKSDAEQKKIQLTGSILALLIQSVE